MNRKDPIYNLHHKDVVLRAENFLITLKSDSLKPQSDSTFKSDYQALEYGTNVIKDLLELLESGPE